MFQNFINQAFPPSTQWVAVICILLGLLNVLVFGLGHSPSWDDAREYSGYASSISNRLGYSLGDGNFVAYREPGYPLFVSFFYTLFGDENIKSVFIAQGILVGFVGIMVYFIFLKLRQPSVGFFAGVSVALFPLFGHYAGEILSESLFMFLIVAVFLNILVIIFDMQAKDRYWTFIMLGILCGYASLVRMQFIFLLPLLLLSTVLIPKYRSLLKYVFISSLGFVLVLGSWMMVVYTHTGKIVISEGRQEIVLHVRTERIDLGYIGQLKYLAAWLSRSIPGSNWQNNYYLTTYDWSGASAYYDEVATSPLKIAEMKNAAIQKILEHPSVFLFGNFVEAVKLLYMEHVDSPVLGRMLRAFLYVVVYGFCAYGIFTLCIKQIPQKIKVLQVMCLLFIGYNIATLTFFDTIPRYNVPYLVFFIIIGFTGYFGSRRGLAKSQEITTNNMHTSHESTQDIASRTITDFGEQWLTYTKNPGYYGDGDLLLEIFGPLLTKQDLHGTKTAEIGSGTGRIVNMLLDNGVDHVFAVEPSDAFEVLKHNIENRKDKVTCLRIAGDALPATLNLDYVFSIGVIHHIPDPVPTLRAARQALCPGGKIVIWVYGEEGNRIYLSLIRPIRSITQRLPHRVLHVLCSILLVFLNAYIFLSTFVPLPMHTYMQNVLARFPHSVRHMTIYDQLNPSYSKYYKKDDAIALLKNIGFTDIQIFHRHGYSWTLIGTNPK